MAGLRHGTGPRDMRVRNQAPRHVASGRPGTDLLRGSLLLDQGLIGRTRRMVAGISAISWSGGSRRQQCRKWDLPCQPFSEQAAEISRRPPLARGLLDSSRSPYASHVSSRMSVLSGRTVADAGPAAISKSLHHRLSSGGMTCLDMAFESHGR